MAVLSDYTSGTITLANGSTVVTGTGTLFDVAKFREGDTLQIQNLTAVIASVNSNTSLTLTAPWTGTSLTDAPYRARYLPDGARVTAQATTLIELLGNGVLSNLAELGVEEGKTPVGNAAGEYELKPVPTDPNGTLAKFAALTLAARQILQTDGGGELKQVALASNKFLRTDVNADLSQGDLTALGAALLNLTGTNGNIPVMTGAGTVASRPIVGTVSQSVGVPSGAIVERGSNANGQYVKWADGTMMCWRNVISAGSGWKTSGINAPFSSAFLAGTLPVVQVTSNPPDPGYAGIAEARFVSTTTCLLVAPGITDIGTSAFFGVTAHGRWF